MLLWECVPSFDQAGREALFGGWAAWEGEGVGGWKRRKERGNQKENSNVRSIISMRSPLPPLRGPKSKAAELWIVIASIFLDFFGNVVSVVSVCKCIEVIKHL